MESLYTKYRPQTFEQVVGQKHVVETLKRAVTEGRTSHAYLFCGPRGTGKTTMARLLAKALMCEKGAGQLPDGTCEQCRLIAAGEHPDVAELDAASRTGVDNVREEILSRVNYAPTMGRCKVYIIDEVHMLTPAAFNALLKTLEEPPEHVVFIMCTTDPQKILATILSRVQRFDFHSIGSDEMLEHLCHVCEQEGFTYEKPALELVVRHARGGMRDALTSLEQLSVFGNGNISMGAAQDFLGEVSGSVLGQMATAIAQRDVPALFAEVENLMNSGRDLLQFTRELAAHMRDLYVVCAAPDADAVAGTADDIARLKQEAAAFGSPDRLARVLSVLGDASSQMRTATNQRLVLEIALTKLARPETDLTLESLADRLSTLEQQLASGAFAAAAPAAPAAQQPVPATSSTPAPAPAVTVAAPAAQPVVTVAQPAPQAAAAPARPAASAGVSPHATRAASEARSDERGASGRNPGAGGRAGEPVNAPTRPAVTDPSDLQRTWKRVIDNLVHEAPSKGSLLMSSSAVSDDGEKLVVALPAGSRFAAKMLERADVREVIDGVVRVAFGRRQLLFTEDAAAPKPAAAPRPAAAPAPKPAAASAPAPASRPAPAPMPQSAPAPQPSAPMPWDDEPPMDAYGYVPEEAEAAASAAPAPAPVSAPAENFSATRAASEERSDERGAGEVLGGGASAPADPEPAAEAVLGTPATAPDDLPTEFADIASMLGEVFGAPASVSVESPVTTSDDDAAAELAYDADLSAADEFADEPQDDADSDD